MTRSHWPARGNASGGCTASTAAQSAQITTCSTWVRKRFCVSRSQPGAITGVNRRERRKKQKTLDDAPGNTNDKAQDKISNDEHAEPASDLNLRGDQFHASTGVPPLIALAKSDNRSAQPTRYFIEARQYRSWRPEGDIGDRSNQPVSLLCMENARPLRGTHRKSRLRSHRCSNSRALDRVRF